MNEYDVIVIGSGPIGAICAKQFVKQGLSVLILEAGSNISSPTGSHLRNQAKYRSNPDLFFEEIDKWCQFYHKEAPPESLPGAHKTEIVGGQSLIWTNNCPRPVLFEGESLGLNQSRLEQRLKEAEDILFVQTHLFDDSIRQKKLAKCIQDYLNQSRFHRVIEKLPIAATRDPEGNIQFIAIQNILEAELKTASHLHLLSNIKVFSLQHMNSRIISIETEDRQGLRKKYFAKHFLIAGGVFETPHLLYHSNIKLPALGKFLHYHPLIMCQIVLNPSLSAPAGKIDSPPRLYIPPTYSHPWHAMILRDISPFASPELIDENQLIEMQFFAPTEVRKENEMILGILPQQFSFHFTQKDKEMIDRMKQDQHELASLIGRFRKGCEPTFLPLGISHPMGTCRMGNDSNNSVVNDKGQVHGFDNLFLAGLSIIPIPIAVNPTLTAAALAIETCDFICNKMISAN